MHEGRVPDICNNLSRVKGHFFPSVRDVYSSGDGSYSSARPLGTSSLGSSDYRTRFLHIHKSDYARNDGSSEDLACKKHSRSVECGTRAGRPASQVVDHDGEIARLHSVALSLLPSVEPDRAGAVVLDPSGDSLYLANEQKGSNEELEFSSSLEDNNDDDSRYGTLVMLPLAHGCSSGDVGVGSDDDGVDDRVVSRAAVKEMTRTASDGGLEDCCEDDSSDDDLDEEQNVTDVTDALDFLCSVSLYSQEPRRGA